MGITVLLPGGFKPPHGGHIQLAKNYAENPKVDNVMLLVGPKDRDGITRDQSIAALQLLLKDRKIDVVPTTQESPMGAAFDVLLNPDASGTYALGASSKGSDAERLEMFAKSIEGYKTKPDRDGRTVPKSVNIDTGLTVDIQPMKYKGRKDAYDGTEISATVARQDLRDGDKNKFATNYPGVDRETTNKLFDMFSKTIKEPEEKKSKKKKLKESAAFGRLLEQRAIGRMVMMQLLKEGGNAIPTSIPVDKADVKEVVKNAIKALPKELRDKIQINIGSSGYKAQSGDIDVFVDEDAVIEYFGAKEAKDAKKSMQKYFQDNGFESVVSGRNVHIGVPYKDASAQVDFMVIRDASTVAPWHQHGPRKSYEDPDFKGSDIFILISSIAKSLGLKFEPFSANLVKRDDNKVVARDRDKVAKILLNPKATGEDLNSVKSILRALENDPKRDEKLAQAKGDEEKGLVKMTFKESLLKESRRDIEHPEDLIYWEGYNGAKKALEALKQIDQKKISVKWDGSPAVVFGYDENGDFTFGDKYAGKMQNAQQLKKTIVDRGARNEKDYSAFGTAMEIAYNKAKESIKDPKNNALYHGDMLYFEKPKVEDNKYVFKPNTVTYKIPTNSELGKNIGDSTTGVVVHYAQKGKEKLPVDQKEFVQKTGGMLVMTSMRPKSPIKADQSLYSKAKSAVDAAGPIANKLLDESELSKNKMKGILTLIQSYTNSEIKNFKNLSAKNFENFLVKKGKGKSAVEYVQKNENDFNTVFEAVKAIADLKNDIISKLDSGMGNEVEASIGSSSGGEGYVIDDKKIKLVNRSIFSAANVEAHS